MKVSFDEEELFRHLIGSVGTSILQMENSLCSVVGICIGLKAAVMDTERTVLYMGNRSDIERSFDDALESAFEDSRKVELDWKRRASAMKSVKFRYFKEGHYGAAKAVVDVWSSIHLAFQTEQERKKEFLVIVDFSSIQSEYDFPSLILCKKLLMDMCQYLESSLVIVGWPDVLSERHYAHDARIKLKSIRLHFEQNNFVDGKAISLSIRCDGEQQQVL